MQMKVEVQESESPELPGSEEAGSTAGPSGAERGALPLPSGVDASQPAT